jgi:UDP-N-acetylmuramoyl-tripeptide--D-alanyl-D-alanine ligase
MSGGQVENFAKVATAAKILGVSDGVIGDRILQWKPGEMRGETINFLGHEVYLDCYNANPMAMLDALQFFDYKYPGDDNMYILGGMGELGEFSEACHKIVATYFYHKKNIIVFAIGKEMRILYDRLWARGSKVFYFEKVEQSQEFFRKGIQGNVFIKGSRCSRLWELVENENEEHTEKK